VLAEGKRRVDALRVLFARLDRGNELRVGQSLAAATTAADQTRTITLVSLPSIMLLIVLSGWYLVPRVSWPLRRMSVAANAFSAGDLSARAPESGPGEVRHLGRSFNEMAAGIADAVRRLQAQNDLLAQARVEADQIAAELSAQQEIAVDLIATIGFDGTFKRLNPAWERTLGYPDGDLISRPFIDLVDPDDRERTQAEAARLADLGDDTLSFENRYRTRSGNYRWLEWNVRPVAEQELLYSVARDVTDRKDADTEIRSAREEADRANLAKSEFLSRMSHELRTPLNAILGFGQLLEMNGLAERDGESVQQILGAGHHLLSLIDEVLDISRIKAGTMRISVEPVEVASALAEVVGLMGPVAAEQRIEITMDAPADVECYALADRQRLRQVVLNLVSNAVKYNRPEGTVHVSSSCEDGRVKIAVADTGPGIAADRLGRLFVAFDRLGAEAGDVQGTGLGLALSKSLAEHMGGSLTARSTPGTGSVFTVELEAATDPVGRGLPAPPPVAVESPEPLGPGTILCIDDNPSNAKLVQHALSGDPGIRVLLAMQGSAGLELAWAQRPDLILLDLHLPDMTGADVLHRLQADPATASIPVVVLSADATTSQVRTLLADGARGYMTKPLDVRAFLAIVTDHLTSKEAPGG
jgi:PAS domain S-box-containing protein